MPRLDLKAALLRERLDLYVRLRGGVSFPLAGAISWPAIATLGAFVPIKTWALWAFVASGLIFPIAVVISRLMRIDSMHQKSSIDDAIAPAFIGMVLFWPMACAAFWSAIQLTPLILAIGMAMHWPIISWTYGRTVCGARHCAHARGLRAPDRVSRPAHAAGDGLGARHLSLDRSLDSDRRAAHRVRTR